MTLHDACGKSIVKASIPLNPLLRQDVITFGGSGHPKAFPPVAHDYIPRYTVVILTFVIRDWKRPPLRQWSQNALRTHRRMQ
jgi:hypothetical protein